MYKNTFYPLRSIVGRSVPIGKIMSVTKLGADYSIISMPQTFNFNPAFTDFPEQTIQEKVNLPVGGLFDNGEIYSKFLPEIIKDGKNYIPLPGMATMPLPGSNFLGGALQGIIPQLEKGSDNPFKPEDTVGSLFGFKNTNFDSYTVNVNSNNSVSEDGNPFLSGADNEQSFLVLLKETTLIGGICFSGYPYITSRIEQGTGGMTLGNFGLPREIRITPLPHFGLAASELGYQRNKFIDSEFAYTRQEIISHSGFNYVCIDPVKTNLFMLTLTDFPYIINKIDIDSSSIDEDGIIKLETEGYKGFAIPYLYFFEYKESTHRNAKLHGGLLGVKSDAIVKDDAGATDIMKMAFPEYEFYLSERGGTENGYALYTAHSALGQRRSFPLKGKMGYPAVLELLLDKETKLVEEMFISDVLQKDEKVILYLQQGEEYDRCVAGLKMLFPMLPRDTTTETLVETMMASVGATTSIDNHLDGNERKLAEEVLALMLGIPDEINFCEQIRIRIFELDPIEGISPAAIDIDSKYATLLVNTEIDDFKDVFYDYFLRGMPFKRVSSSKYFAIELTNTGDEEGQIVIHSMHLVRSAHASVQPRAAKTQQVKAMHYRIIGPELADDFSKLGTEGFNFSIDRVVAGQTKNVLYSAMSLLDLLHTGNARIHSNARRRAEEFEMVENYKQYPKKYPGEIRKYEVKEFPGDDFTGRNFENREADTNSIGWRSSETGKSVQWPLDKGDPTDYIDGFEFESYSGTETRARIQQISSIGDELFTQFELLEQGIRDRLAGIIDVPNLIDAVTAASKIFKLNINDPHLWQPFKGFEESGEIAPELENLPPISGVETLNIPPFYLEFVDLMTNLVGTIARVVTPLNEADATSPEQTVDISIDIANIDDAISKLTLINGINIGYNVGENGGFNAGLSGGITVPPFSGGLNVGASIGGSAGYTFGVNSNLASSFRSSSNGSNGNINQSGQEVKYSLNRNLQSGFDNTIVDSELYESEVKRIVTRRELLNRDPERVRGAEVMWQGKIQDIITGSVPLNFTLPATATKLNFRTADDALRIRFNSGFSNSIEVDFWFELTEETLKDDY